MNDLSSSKYKSKSIARLWRKMYTHDAMISKRAIVSISVSISIGKRRITQGAQHIKMRSRVETLFFLNELHTRHTGCLTLYYACEVHNESLRLLYPPLHTDTSLSCKITRACKDQLFFLHEKSRPNTLHLLWSCCSISCFIPCFSSPPTCRLFLCKLFLELP